MLPATCLPEHCFCEQILPQAIAQPVNTWSGLAFVLVGVFVMWLSKRDLRKRTNPLTTHRTYGLLYGWLLIFVGVGTLYYHAQFTYLGQFIDGVGIYFIATAILFYQYSRVHKIRPMALSALYGISNVPLSYLLYQVHSIGRYVFALMIFFIMRAEYHPHLRRKVFMDKKLLYAAFEIFLIGFVIWALDATKTLCNPTSVIQGHAIWHLLTALSALLIYLYYRSERVIKRR